MFIPDKVRKCVVYLYYLDKDEIKRPAGTAFFVGIVEEYANFIYLFTAKHVIVAINEHGSDGKVYIRMNTIEGGYNFIVSKVEEWRGHPTDSSIDAAVLPMVLDKSQNNHIFISTTMTATAEIIKNNGIGIGEEVFITGLFLNHIGKAKNTPIVRIGNIAAMPEEKIDTKTFGSMDAYLIESRSTGGLSGSPVFVNLGITRSLDGQVKFSNAPLFYWLGLIHGHWDQDDKSTDNINEDVLEQRINMGIAIVVPAEKLLEIIMQPTWITERKRLYEDFIAKS